MGFQLGRFRDHQVWYHNTPSPLCTVTYGLEATVLPSTGWYMHCAVASTFIIRVNYGLEGQLQFEFL